MATLTATLSNVTGSFSLSIKRKDTNAAITCNSGCSSGTATTRLIDFNADHGYFTYVFTVTDASGCTSTVDVPFSDIECTCPTITSSCSGTPNYANVSTSIGSHSGTNTYTAQLVNSSNVVVSGSVQNIPAGGLNYTYQVPHNQQYTMQIVKNGGTVICTTNTITAANCPCTLSITVNTPSCA